MEITGTSSSRLVELRKYTVTNVFTNQYVGGGNWTTDGVDYPNSVSGVSVTYYLGGIKYVDKLVGTNTGTTFTYTPQGISSPDFINKPYYKNPNKENIEYIKNLVELETYAGGNYFNIVKNT